MKPVVLHIIDTLGRGGAEKLLVNVVNALDNDFDNIVLYFSAPNDLESELKNAKVICLDIPFSISKLFKIAGEIKKVAEQNNVSIIHSHSYWTNLAVRLAHIQKAKIFQSYHNAVYDTMWNKPTIKLLALFDKITYRKKIKLIAVSDYVKNILKRKLNFRNITVLKNFIDDPCFLQKESMPYIPGTTLKVISVGNIKSEKNYGLVIKAFEAGLKNRNIQYDVFGGGKELEKYRNQLKEKEIDNLRFMGTTSSVYSEIIKYDLFCMTSFSEACPLSPLEAMKAKLPILLSDIPAFKEIAENSVMYFQSGKANDFLNKLIGIFEGSIQLDVNENLYNDILIKYSKEKYIKKISNIYLQKVDEN